MTHQVWMDSAADAPDGQLRKVRVDRPAEKGSDVNLASHLLTDAFDGAFDVALLVTNDSDFVSPIRLVRDRFKRKVMIYSPQPKVNPELKRISDYSASIRVAELVEAQFPNPLETKTGMIRKPERW